MVLPKRKIAKIREMRKHKVPYREIREKIGASFDAIAKYGRDPQPSPTPSTPAPPPGKNPIVAQEQTDKFLHNIATALEKNQLPTTSNKPDPHIQLLEDKVNLLEQTQQRQERANDPQFQL